MSDIDDFEERGEEEEEDTIGSSNLVIPLHKLHGILIRFLVNGVLINELFVVGLEYEGRRNDNCQRHGYGRALLPNKDYYEGGYYQGMRQGLGLYIFKNGARYNGNYKQGVKHGIGTFYFPDGSKYEGEWKNDKRHGYGVYYYTNGDFYEGQWRNGKREGLGCYVYKETGAKYIGTWSDGKMEGPGQLITPAYRYHGVWKENMPKGIGCYTFKSNVMQHGFYKHVTVPKVHGNEEVAPEEEGEQEGTKIIPVWMAREISPYVNARLPPEPFEYPVSPLSSESMPSTPPPETDVYKYDFFKDIAQYEKYYQDNLILWAADQWDNEILDDMKLKKPDITEELEEEEGLAADQDLPPLSDNEN